MRILLLEDSHAIQLLTKARLEKEGHEVDAVDNGQQGFQLATGKSYDVIVSDIQMPHWDGFKFIEAMEVISPQLPIVIVSSSENDPLVTKRLHKMNNVMAVVPKPLDFQLLFNLLGKVQIQGHQGVKKQARIVCTIGPASNNAKILGQMIVAGMNVARLNFSHGTHEQHAETLIAVREAEEFWNRPIAVLQDLCGPKIRTGSMENGQVQLTAGEKICIQKDEIVGTKHRISTIVPEIIDDLEVGDPILLDDGLFELKVVEKGADEVRCEVIVGGILKSSKGMNLPRTSLSLPSVTEKDWRDLDWALDHSIDYIALSFVRTAEEIRTIKKYIKKSGKRNLRVIAKIEKPEAVNNIKEIIEVSDGIMIARGDMGVELPAPRVPRIQQEIIRLCWQMNTPVITATQMLDSMTTNSRPTRAEVTDVSTAISEGTDAVMLSQETATGIDPVNVVRTMATIISEEEHYSQMDPEQLDLLMEENLSNPVLTAVAGFKNSAATFLLDATGELYPALSKWSRTIPSVLVTKSLHVARHATLYKNITPLIIREDLDRDQTVFRGLEIAKQIGVIKEGDLISVVEGARLTEGGIHQRGALQILSVPNPDKRDKYLHEINFPPEKRRK